MHQGGWGATSLLLESQPPFFVLWDGESAREGDTELDVFMSLLLLSHLQNAGPTSTALVPAVESRLPLNPRAGNP